MKSTVSSIEWRIIVGTITFNVSVKKNGTGYTATFDRGIPPLKGKQMSRQLAKNHILNHKQIKEII